MSIYFEGALINEGEVFGISLQTIAKIRARHIGHPSLLSRIEVRQRTQQAICPHGDGTASAKASRHTIQSPSQL